MTIPPAEGIRVSWGAVPESVRAGIGRICGAPVVRASSQPGGFSPGVAARLLCADGTRWFVKAVSAEANPVTPAMHRREAQILRALDPLIAASQLPVPRLRGALERTRGPRSSSTTSTGGIPGCPGTPMTWPRCWRPWTGSPRRSLPRRSTPRP